MATLARVITLNPAAKITYYHTDPAGLARTRYGRSGQRGVARGLRRIWRTAQEARGSG